MASFEFFDMSLEDPWRESGLQSRGRESGFVVSSTAGYWSANSFLVFVLHDENPISPIQILIW